jgi:Raf kinase inhibitor-like YbhB/YbcL family protein
MKHAAVAIFLSAMVAGSTARASAAGFSVHSISIADNGSFSAKYASDRCGGQNVSPALSWSDAPAGTKSFAVVMFDVDGQRGLGSVHWVAYAIGHSTASLAEGLGSGGSGLVGGTLSPGNVSYRGPCPPVGDAPHHYVLSVYALDLARNAYAGGMTRDELFAAIKGHILAESSVIATYAR